MSFDLDAKENTLTIKDAITGEYVKFRYRTPTPTEIQRYSSASIRRERNKIIANPTTPKLKYGTDILTGVGNGYFQTGGKMLVTSPAEVTDSEKEIFVENWKDLIREKAPHLIILLAATVFDGSHSVQDEPDISVEEPGEAGEDAVPFPKS